MRPQRGAPLAIALAALLAGGACSGSSSEPSPSAPPSSTTSTATGGAQSLDGAADPLAPGRYTKPGFAPELTFAVGPGWHAVQDSPGFFDLQRQPGTLDVVAVQFARLIEATSAQDVLADLRQREGLTVRSAGDRRLGGLPSTRIVVDNADPDLKAQHFTDALPAEPGMLAIASGRRLQIDVLDTPDGLLGILVGGSVRNWAATERIAEPVVHSVEFLN